jgi:hypothetical protein
MLTHKFVEFIPETLEDRVLYVSMIYGTVSHKCGCGCGREVVTPLTPTDWKLIFDGETISLHPSIGNWNYPCRSHYWIRNDRVLWAESKDEIRATIKAERVSKERHYESRQAGAAPKTSDSRLPAKPSFWTRIWMRIFKGK